MNKCQKQSWSIQDKSSLLWIITWMSRWTLSWVPKNHLIELLKEENESWRYNYNMQARSLSPVQTDDMLARGVGSKCEFSLAAVNLRMVKLPQNLKTSYSCKIPWKGWFCHRGLWSPRAFQSQGWGRQSVKRAFMQESTDCELSWGSDIFYLLHQ